MLSERNKAEKYKAGISTNTYVHTSHTHPRIKKKLEGQKVTSDKHLQEEAARAILSSPTGTPTTGSQVFPKSGQAVSSTILYTATLEVDRKLKAH